MFMHEKLIKQLRNNEHCSGCPYDEDCNEFDSCLMDLLAADTIENMSKKIVRLEKELQDISLRCQQVNQTKEAVWIYDHWCEFKCSNCGNWSNSKPYKGMEKYCPECGYKMKNK